MAGNMAEGARFENAPASETIGADSPSSFPSQSLSEESEAGGEPIRTDVPHYSKLPRLVLTWRGDAKETQGHSEEEERLCNS